MRPLGGNALVRVGHQGESGPGCRNGAFVIKAAEAQAWAARRGCVKVSLVLNGVCHTHFLQRVGMFAGVQFDQIGGSIRFLSNGLASWANSDWACGYVLAFAVSVVSGRWRILL